MAWISDVSGTLSTTNTVLPKHLQAAFQRITNEGKLLTHWSAVEKTEYSQIRRNTSTSISQESLHSIRAMSPVTTADPTTISSDSGSNSNTHARTNRQSHQINLTQAPQKKAQVEGEKIAGKKKLEAHSVIIINAKSYVYHLFLFSQNINVSRVSDNDARPTSLFWVLLYYVTGQGHVVV